LLYLILASGAMAQTTETQTKTQETKGQDSLANAARKNRPKDAPMTTKRVWTDDDFSSAKESSTTITGTSQESASETLRKFLSLGKEELGAAVLKLANAPDVVFFDRRNWEQKLFEAKQAWLDQVDRMVAHKDSAKDAQDEEIRLARGAQKTFERIAHDGIQQARAVNDPVLKAHLQYQRQLDFCKQTTGDLLQKCQDSLDQLKWQMQREGTW
jgi:hypothetical protein